MQLYMPTRVYSEENCVLAHAAELRAQGKKAMIVTGRHSAKATGALQDVVQALGETPYVIFDRIEENPSVETVMEARAAAIAEQVDFCVGIGGGDIAAVGILHGEDGGSAGDLPQNGVAAEAEGKDVMGEHYGCGGRLGGRFGAHDGGFSQQPELGDAQRLREEENRVGFGDKVPIDVLADAGLGKTRAAG
jgi:hypothetical protein